MVSYGAAVAQNARKRQKESSTMNAPTRPKNPNQTQNQQPTPRKAAPKNERIAEQKAKKKEEIQQSKEMLAIKQVMDKGVDMGTVDLKEIDRAIRKMNNDEMSDEEYSEDEHLNEIEKRRENEILSNEPITNKKMLQKYHLDQQDYMLQYSTGKDLPIYFEEYTPHGYSTFQGCDILDGGIPVKTANKTLLLYASQVMQKIVPQKILHFPEIVSRKTAPHTNMCFNPLQAMRGWALLVNLSQNKTKIELSAFIEFYTGGSFNGNTHLNDEVLSLHVSAEEDFDGCVRLFTEMPRHMYNDSEYRRKINMTYGGKSRRPAIQHHCFATDSDGFYSCYRINEEISLSTRGAVRYVVPENYAPNWRASIAVASAMDCTFYWKTDGPANETKHFRFCCEKYGTSKCTGILAKATFRCQDNIFRLESHLDGVHLFIIVENPAKVSEEKQISKDILQKIYDSDTWPITTDKNIFIPKCTTSTPISLYDHAKHNGLSRLFSCEKSELRKLKETSFDQAGSPQFVTLFDHYHKSVFEICATKPNNSGISRHFDELAPERAHQCIDDSTAKLFGNFQNGEDNESVFTYYEDHLDRNIESIDEVKTDFQFNVATPNDIDLGKPFYYVMTRQHKDEPIILCTGYFNNTIWVKSD